MSTTMRVILAAALVLGLAGSAPCQVPTPGSEEGDRLMAYESFFFRVALIEDHANQVRAQGRQTPVLSSVKGGYGLTEEQYSQLAAIAVDWKAKWSANIAKASPLLAQGMHASSSPSLHSLLEERVQMTWDHRTQLQSALGGPMRLAALEALIMKPSVSGPIFPK